MADHVLVYGTSQTLTVSGFATLANASSATSATITNTADKWLDFILDVTVTTGSASLATGIVEVFAKGSLDGTDFDDDFNDKWIGTISAGSAGAVSRTRLLSVASAFGFVVPPYVRIRCRNATGAALTDAGIIYQGVRTAS